MFYCRVLSGRYETSDIVCLSAASQSLEFGWLLCNRWQCLHLVALGSLIIYPTASVPSYYGFKISEPLTDGCVGEETKSLSAKLCEIGESRRKAQCLIFGRTNSRRTCLWIDNNNGRLFKMDGKPLVNTQKQMESSTDVFPVHIDVRSRGRGTTFLNEANGNTS